MDEYKIVELTCGLGNQMFQYAFAKALQKHLQVPILLDKTWYDIKENAMQFGLDIFQIDLEYATQEQIEHAKSRITKLPGFLRKIFGIKKHRIAYSQAFDFHEEYLLPNDFLYFSGFFQNPKYFKDISMELRSNFAYSSDNFSDFAKQRLEKILRAKNSVFIHIRRGDYCKLGWELDMHYYKKAVQYILSHLVEPNFFVFGATDKTFMQHLDLEIPFENLSEEIITHANQHEDMLLMHYCKHAIIANSSYSFWGAYLGEDRRDKIVVAPTPWLLENDNIICDNWIKISTKEE